MNQINHFLLVHSQNSFCVFVGLSTHFTELSRHKLYQLKRNAFAELGIAPPRRCVFIILLQPISKVTWFQECELWQDNSYEPRPGDIIFFDWDDGGQDGSSDHVGIVEKMENGRIYTIEGNSVDSRRQNSYPVGYCEIYGYGTPAY